jgi:hypothetical protein
MKYPRLQTVNKIDSVKNRLLISAYGFEERSLAWTAYQVKLEAKLNHALIVKYLSPKGKNKIQELKKNLKRLGVKKPTELEYDVAGCDDIETNISNCIQNIIYKYDEVVIDITAMTKYLILVLLCKLVSFEGSLRLIYAEAEDYAPNIADYKKYAEKIKNVLKFPSRGFGTILRAQCLSSIRMQGQPVTLVAFTSFNEQLVRHMLGTISPHKLIFINGNPPRVEYKWRKKATSNLHNKLISEYPLGNDLDENGTLLRSVSTLNYIETIASVDKIYVEYGSSERIIIAATGSKMQTLGLFFSKIKHPDIHIEYPTPDSYYIKGFSFGVKEIHELNISNFKLFLEQVKY